MNEDIYNTEPSPGGESASWLQRNLKLVAIVVVVLLAAISVVSFLNWQRGVRAEGYERQNNALAKYQGVQTTLSTCLDNTSIGASVAERERATILKGMKEVVAARTANNQSAIPGDATIFVNAVAEAYPAISQDLYKQMMTVAVGCRNEVNGAQKDMQAYAARFNTWTKQGSIFEALIRESYPNAELVIEGPNGILNGKAALNSMATPIITSEAEEASKSKEMPSQDLFPETTE